MNTKPFQIALFGALLPFAFAQDESPQSKEADVERIVIPFSSATDRSLEASLMNGSITVRGYDGNDVVLEISNPQGTRDFRFNNQKADAEQSDKSDTTPNPNAGLRPLKSGSTGVFAEAKGNHITIGSKNMNSAADLALQVPHETDLKLSCMNGGDIAVENVRGELDLENLNGKVIARAVSGAVLAHTLNEDIVVAIDEAYPESSMSFITLNGDIDVTLPPETKATLRMESFAGGIHTDFDIDLVPDAREPTTSDERSSGGSFRIEIDQAIVGAINGGGPKYVFNTHNGDIRIRQKK